MRAPPWTGGEAGRPSALLAMTSSIRMATPARRSLRVPAKELTCALYQPARWPPDVRVAQIWWSPSGMFTALVRQEDDKNQDEEQRCG